MSQTIQLFPRTFAPGDSPRIVALLHTDEEDIEEATAVADLFRLEIAEPIEEDLEADATEVDPGQLHLACRLPAETTDELPAGVYFLRFRVTLASGTVLTIPPDDRLRLRVT